MTDDIYRYYDYPIRLARENAELKKRIAELKTRLEREIAWGKAEHTLKMERIKGLEKENAELRQAIEKYYPLPPSLSGAGILTFHPSDEKDPNP